MAVNVKLGVDTSSFRSGIQDANAQLKNFDAQLKLADSTMKATGNTEAGMASKMQALNGKLSTQKQMVQQYEQQLKRLRESGVDPLNRDYQKLETQLLNTQASMMETEAALNGLDGSQLQAASSAEKLTQSMNGISKKISLDQVIGGINTITTGLENAAKKAVDLGRQIWDNIVDSARWADDTATQAGILNMNVEDYQKYKKVFDTYGEITVQEWQKAKLKVQQAINEPTQEKTDILSILGISTHEIQQGKYGAVQGAARDFEDVFWEIGETLRAKVESGELTQDMADLYANALFGRGFAGLNNLFKLGREGFTAALDEQNVVTEESVEDLANLSDRLTKLKGDFETLKAEVAAGLAPALEKAATVLDGLLTRLIEYLQKPEGQEMLERMGKAVEGLFSDLSEIDPEAVVEGFASVFEGIVGGLQWLDENRETVIGAMKAILVGWGALTIGENVLKIMNLVDGLRGLGAAGGKLTIGADGGLGSSIAGALAGVTVAVSLAAITCGPLLAKLIRGETPEEQEARELEEKVKAAEVSEVFEKAGKPMPTNQELLRYAMTGKLPASYTQRVEEERQEPGYAMPKGKGIIHKDRRTGEIIDGPDPALLTIWNEMTGLITDSGDVNDGSKIKKFAQRYMDWFNDNVTDSALDQITEAMDQDAFDRFHDTMLGIISGENLYSDQEREDFLGAFNDAIAAAEKLMEEKPPKFEIDPKVPENAAEIISGLVGVVPIAFAPGGTKNTDILSLGRWPLGGSNANGLPFVPYDGYLSILHKGERVVPAREAASRNFSSNLYVESMYMNNGQDADGLAAAMAAAQRRTMSGYGS